MSKNMNATTAATTAATTTTTTTTNRTRTTSMDVIIEQEAGVIVGQYSCVYEGVNGVLYAGSNALYFVGTYFLFDKKIKLPWEIIRQVSKMDQGVQIRTKAGSRGDAVHTFSAMHQPARVWPVLVSLHNDALMDRKPGTGLAGPQPLKRRNSDPSKFATSLIVVADDYHRDNDDGDSSGNNSNKVGHHSESSNSDMDAVAAVPPKSSSASAGKGDVPNHFLSVPGLTLAEIQEKLGEIRMPSEPCTHGGVRGSLYAGSRGLYFYGKRFFWDITRLHFPFASLRQVKILHEKQGIRLVCSRSSSNSNGANSNSSNNNNNTQSSPLEYVFVDMENPDKVWASLIELHGEILSKRAQRKQQHQAPRGAATEIFRRATYVRTNSDPEFILHRPGASFEFDNEEEDAHPDGNVGGNDEEEEEQLKGLSTTVVTKRKSSVKTESMDRSEVHILLPPPPDPSKELDMAKEWAACVAKKSNYPNLIVQDLELKCSLDQLYHGFLDNNAPHSIAKYLESRGDSNLSTSDWKTAATAMTTDCEEQLLQGQTRVIHYSHPVNAPLAPPRAGARKEQHLIRYGDVGICLETRTIVDDVPMADCFRVDDRIRIEAKGANQVSVTMEFEITFVKSTMFKSIISKTTKTEFSDFFRQMALYISNAFDGADNTLLPAVEPPEQKTDPERQPLLFATLRGGAEKVMNPSLIHPLLTVLVLLVQLYILWELKVMKSDMVLLSLQQRSLHRDCPAPSPASIAATATAKMTPTPTGEAPTRQALADAVAAMI